MYFTNKTLTERERERERERRAEEMRGEERRKEGKMTGNENEDPPSSLWWEKGTAHDPPKQTPQTKHIPPQTK